jgi:Type II secretion system (T2SS), protein K
MKGRDRRATGFALVIVLWVLAGLTVVAVAVASSMRSNAQSVKLLRDRVLAEREFLSTSSRIKVIASTALPRVGSFLSLRGELMLDGRRTIVSDKESVLLHDSFGMVNLNSPYGEIWPNVLRYCGASETDVPALMDALADYIDVDNLKRLNGAESFEYSSAGLKPMRNAQLLSRDELWRVKGWSALRTAWKAHGCDDIVTVRGGLGFNRNTAPLSLLIASGMTEPQAAGLIGARSAGLAAAEAPNPASDGNPLMRIAGGAVGGVFRVRHEMALLGWALQYEIELTSMASGGPWRVHELRVVLPSEPSVSARSMFPAANFLLPERDRDQLNVVPTLPFGQ